ncbi:SpvB/TcaC N-terminal domain-containing protein [Pseudomonas sp.]|uniref:SpvB/TcaC N-terminal domain-containing protein n=1 Tax=Pseudomonas sp. TaxID=306 RepID=UPI00262048A6|nr:SpvB/TcaC N-terminal domain-containing protein [Pseudomonas sp.]
MNTAPTSSPLNVPSLPSTASTLEGIAKGWGSVGADGTATLEIALPLSPGRGYAPQLALTYRSTAGNSAFGFGWDINLSAFSRRTQRGVPSYSAADTFQGPDAQVLIPECRADGAPVQIQRSHFNQSPLDTPYTVTRYFPRVESRFERIEHWRSASDAAGFWLVRAGDGSQQVYGKTLSARISDPDQPEHVAQWLLEESLNAHGEHIGYCYHGDTIRQPSPYDCRAQRYLRGVFYGNTKAREKETLYVFKTDDLTTQSWHFHVVFDYGQRTAALDRVPPYDALNPWPLRGDPFSSYAYGFERRTQYLCRQVLMFHRFPDEPAMGPAPVLVKRLLLQHRAAGNGLSMLTALYEQAVDAKGLLTSLPPQEFNYQSSALHLGRDRYQRLEGFPGLNDGQRYHLVDLHGEGLPGMLYQGDGAWYYRAPQRSEKPSDTQAVTYAPAQALPAGPAGEHPSRPVHQALLDVDGDGRPEWVLARPDMSGFFRLNAQPGSGFVPFDAFPVEYFHPGAVFADLMGAGLGDLALISPRSVRLYANRQQSGFAAGIELAHGIEGDDLPSLTPSSTDWVGFSDVLGSGQQHLVRIRHNEITCWPNLGRGKFGKGRVLAKLSFKDTLFKAADVRLADLDGCGAADLLYLSSDDVRIYRNQGADGFAETPLILPWPPGVQYDDLCQVSMVDLHGQGCASLIITTPHPNPQHWHYRFFERKPGLLNYTCNNLGAQCRMAYRSSAQEWLDEKKQALAEGTPRVSRVPFALNLVSRQIQHDEITGNTLTQHFSYRQGYYDPLERSFQGYGLLLQTNSEAGAGNEHGGGILSKRWFHTGRLLDMPHDGYSRHDPQAITLGGTLLGQLEVSAPAHPSDHHDRLIVAPTPAQQRDAAYALRGLPLRVEVFARTPSGGVPYSVRQHRYLVRQLAPASATQPWARMLPLALESVVCNYEQVDDDPACEHQINLRWDPYAGVVHSVTVHHARRKTMDDAPPAQLVDAHQQRWWRDTHDPAQQACYLSETLAQWIHLTQEDQWRLGLPYRQRLNTWVMPKGEAPTGLSSAAVSYEAFIPRNSGPLGPQAPRELSGLSVQRYREAGGKGVTLAPGVATVQALSDCVETAELDPNALHAYAQIPALPGETPWDLKQQLQHIGYHPMEVFFCASTAEVNAPPELWSVRRQFPRYLNAKRFYRLRSWRLTESLGEATLDYDPYCCHVTQIKQADGCVTLATYDYRVGQPIKLTDPNGTVHQARYDGFGRVVASSFHGTEAGKATGFGPLSADGPALDSVIDQALTAPETVQGNAASTYLYAPFSWMGTIAKADIRAHWVAKHYLMPDGHIPAAIRESLKKPAGNDSEDKKNLRALIAKAPREPVHCLTLQADRYPGDEARQIRMTLTHWDGFGRTLQSKQKTEPGLAYQVTDDGMLSLEDNRIKNVNARTRWRVSERVEHNNQGWVIRVYRPYFADRHGYINDVFLREHGHSDRQFYDPTGRPTRTVNANGSFRRITYWAWYTVSEDENDTAGQPSAPAPITG